jgi:hypothetical protein
VERIWLERSDDVVVAPTSSSMAIECALELCGALIRQGVARSEAIARVAAAEPFDGIDNIEAVLDSRIDRLLGKQDE